MSPVVITLVVLDTLHSAADLGIVLAASELPFVAFLLVGGVLADRFSRRLLMVTGSAATGLVWLAMALILVAFRLRLAELVTVAAVTGVVSAVTTPTSTGLLPQTVTAGRLPDASALLGITQSATGVAGPALGGVLVTLAGPGTALAVMASCYLTAGGWLTLLRAGHAHGSSQAGIAAQLREGWAEFRARGWLAASVAGFSLWHLLVYAPFVIAGAVIARQAHGPAAWPAMLTCLAAGTLLGGFSALHLRPRRPVVAVMAATAVFSAALFALGAGAPLVVTCVTCVAAGVTVALSNVWWDVTIQAMLPGEVLGRISSYDYLGTAGLLPLGYLLAGPLAVALGPAPVLVAAGVAGLVISLAVCALPSARTLLAVTAGPPAHARHARP